MFGDNSSKYYKVLFLVFVFLGSVVTATNIWNFGDYMILSMAFPNILGVFILSGTVKKDLDEYMGNSRPGSSNAMSSAARRSCRRVLEISHPDRGIYGVIVVDSLGQLGRAFGGVRRREYASRDEVMEDALALAHAMTRKCALAGLPVGGAKTALWVSQPDPQHFAYELVAEEVERLAGVYVCGPDVGTDGRGSTSAASHPVGQSCGQRTRRGRTARGHGRHAGGGGRGAGTRTFRGRTVVLGLGAVSSLARRLLEDGARVLGFDPDPDRRAAAAMGVG